MIFGRTCFSQEKQITFGWTSIILSCHHHVNARVRRVEVFVPGRAIKPRHFGYWHLHKKITSIVTWDAWPYFLFWSISQWRACLTTVWHSYQANKCWKKSSPRCFGFTFAKKTNKQTNRKNTGRDTATAVANYSIVQRARILIKTKQEKNTAIQEKFTATYNKLLDETRDEHYYILNRSRTWTNVGLHNHTKQLRRT